MAGLTQLPTQSPGIHAAAGPWTAAQSRAQFAALARLRWCIFRNSFRRKGGGGELAARIIFLPILGIFAFGPTFGTGFVAHLFVASGRISMLEFLTWGVSALWLVVLLNVSPPGLSFDLNTILRFPLSFPRYLAARIFFGLLSASNVIGTLSLISAVVGIGIARPSLAPWSAFVFAVFALTNIFFVRMMLVWVERWLSTRRAREIFTAFFLFISLGFQYINFNFNPGMQGGQAPPCFHPSSTGSEHLPPYPANRRLSSARASCLFHRRHQPEPHLCCCRFSSRSHVFHGAVSLCLFVAHAQGVSRGKSQRNKAVEPACESSQCTSCNRGQRAVSVGQSRDSRLWT